jgi:hypothetical protein
VQRLTDRIAALEKLPQRAAGYKRVPTGQTFAQVWAEADSLERRRIMTEAGFQIRARRESSRGKSGTLTAWLRFDGELAKRAAAAAEDHAGDVPAAPGWWGRELPDGSYVWRVVIGEDPAKLSKDPDAEAEDFAAWMADLERDEPAPRWATIPEPVDS